MRRLGLLVWSFSTLSILAACGSKDSDTSNTSGGASAGGSSSGGSSTGSGGASSASGGSSTGSGGATVANGGSSNGGATAANGGAAMSGGAPAQGGGVASGGTAQAGGGTGGATMTGGDPCRGTKAPGFVADGLCAMQVGTVNNARQMQFTSNGDLWISSSNGQISRLRDANSNGTYESGEITMWATTGGNGQNVHIDEAGGFLYSGSSAGVKRFAWSATSASGGSGEDVMTGQPSNGGHGKHTVHVWDGYMYVMSGSSGNVSNENTDKTAYNVERSVIKRFKVADFKSGTPFQWSAGEVFVKGIRNVLGFAQDGMGRMYGVQNGQDDVRYGGADVHTNNPGEVLMRLDMGTSHGYPFCMVAQQITGVDPGTQVFSQIYSGNTRDNAWCGTNAEKPVTFMQAHAAPMDIIFFSKAAAKLPARWQGGAFVSLHGSWNRDPGSGKKVVWVPFKSDGSSTMPTVTGADISFPYEVVYGESQDKVNSGSGASSSGGFRPVGLAISPLDGALYISSDGDGKLVRVGSLQ